MAQEDLMASRAVERSGQILKLHDFSLFLDFQGLLCCHVAVFY